MYFFNISKCAPNHIIWFEVYDNFIGKKILKLWRQESRPFSPGWAANVARLRSWTFRLPWLWTQIIVKLFGDGVVKLLMKNRNYLIHNIYWSINATSFWIPTLKFWTDSIIHWVYFATFIKKFPNNYSSFQVNSSTDWLFPAAKTFRGFWPLSCK